MAALSGGNLHNLHGGTTGELVYHPVLSIMDDDIAGWIGRMLEGTTVTDDTMAVDLINDVGPIPGHFLNTAHTREHWRDEHNFPKVADEEAYAVWIAGDKKDMLTLARERMDHILTTHQPEPLTPEQDSAVSKMLDDARKQARTEHGCTEIAHVSSEDFIERAKLVPTSPTHFKVLLVTFANLVTHLGFQCSPELIGSLRQCEPRVYFAR